MNSDKFHQIWKNGPRFLAIAVFTLGFVGKLVNPEIFFTLFYSLNLPKLVPELIFALFVSSEFVLTLLLIKKPQKGVFASIIFLSVLTIGVFYLYMIGFSDPCGFFGGIVMDEIGPSKIFQNFGLILLLFSSFYLRKKIDEV